jgi:flagellar biosynthesis chaperone FliJ
MSPRRNRIEKVITLREKALDQRVAKLSDQRQAEARALSAEEQKQQELQLASESRLKLTEDGDALTAGSWIEANEWLVSRQKQLDQARLEAARAQLETKKAQGAVMTARSDLKKVELLSDRIAQQEQSAAEVLERRLEDELTSMRFGRGEGSK